VGTGYVQQQQRAIGDIIQAEQRTGAQRKQAGGVAPARNEAGLFGFDAQGGYRAAARGYID
jgi:hypothetical protein